MSTFLRRGRACLSSFLLLAAAGCAMRDGGQEPQPVTVAEETEPEPESLSFPVSFDRGLGRLVAMGPDAVEGIGRDLSYDGLLTGLLPGVGNFLTEGLVGDVLMDGLGAGFLYMGASDRIAGRAVERIGRIVTDTHMSLVPSGASANVRFDRREGYVPTRWKASRNYAGKLDQALGALVEMPFGIVRSVGRSYRDNGFVLGTVELVPNVLIGTTAELFAGLGKFGSLLIGQGQSAERIEEFRRRLTDNTSPLTGSTERASREPERR